MYSYVKNDYTFNFSKEKKGEPGLTMIKIVLNVTTRQKRYYWI